jgi:hypothetical protein
MSLQQEQLYTAARDEKKLPALRTLLEQGDVDVNGRDEIQRDYTALVWAISGRNVPGIDLLLKAGADPKISVCGDTVMHWAAFYDLNAAALQLLIDAGAEIDQPGVNGETPLYRAYSFSRVNSPRALLAAGANPNSSDNRGHRIMNCMRNSFCIRYRKDPAQYIQTNAVMLMSYGCRDWQQVSKPCPGMSRLLLQVWQKNPEDLPQLFACFQQNEKTVVQHTLLIMKRFLPRLDPLLSMHMLQTVLNDDGACERL